MSSRDYWKQREENQRQFNIAEEAEYSRRIKEIYHKMYQNIQDDINSFYVKYADKEGITLAEAKRRVANLDINEYAAKAKQYVEQAAKDRAANGGKTDKTAAYFSDQANAEMRLYNATMKINRLELLKAHLGLEMVDGHDELQKLFGDALTKRAMDEFKRQAGILGDTVQNNERFADSIVNASFHNAKFSDRVWMSQDLMKYRLNEILTQALIQGLNPKSLSSRVMPLIKKEILENKRAAADRLLRTELCRAQTDAQMKSFERNGYDRYIFLAEPTACPHCKALDDKVFTLKEMAIGENAPPLHPNCRCSTAAYAESDEEYEKWFYETTEKHSAQWELEHGAIAGVGRAEKPNAAGLKTEEEFDNDNLRSLYDYNNDKIDITDNAINRIKKVYLSGYNHNELINLQEKHKDILRLSKEKNQNMEVAVVTLLTNNENIIVFGTENNVWLGRDPAIKRIIMMSGYNTVCISHNHPNCTTFSYDDLDVFMNPAVKSLTIVTNKGKVMALNKKKNIDYLHIFEYIKNVKSKYSFEKEQPKIMKELLKGLQDFGIEYIR